MATADTIKQYFVNILQRDPTAAETAYWVATVDSNALTLTQARDAIASGPEATTYVDQIVRIYQAAFGRLPDITGINGWTDDLRADATALSKVAAGFVNSTEWNTRYGDNTVNDAVLQSLYQNVLGRAGSAAEIAAWKATGQSMTQILIGFSNSAEFQSKSAPAVMALKQAAGNVATADLATVYDPTKPLFDPSAGTGQTYTLTPGVDNLPGTSGNDTYIGEANGTANSSLSAADTINGGAGTDTAELFLTGANGAIRSSNVEVFQIQASGGARTFTATNVADAEEIWSNGSTSTLTIDNVQNNVTLGLGKTNAALDVNFKAGVIGAAETLKIASDASGTAAASVNVTVNDGGAASKFTTLDVAAVAGKSFVNVAAHATPANATTDFTTLKTSGDGAITLTSGGAVFGNLTTVDLAAAGGSTVNLGANSKAVKVTGGAADDTIQFAQNQFNTQDVVDLGEGKNTLILGDADLAQGGSAELSKAINAAKGVDVLATTATGTVAINAGRYSQIDTFEVGKGGAITAGAATEAGVTLSGVASNGSDTLIVSNNITGNTTGAGLVITPALDSGADKVNLTIATNAVTITGGTAATTTNVGINAASFETIAIDAGKDLTVVKGSTSTATVDTLVGANASITITGSGDVNLGTVGTGAGAGFENFTINAGTLTGSFAVKTGAGNDVITVGSDGSTVAAGNGTDTINLGAGRDTVQFAAATDSGNLNGLGTAFASVDVITNFTAGLGGDVLDWTPGADTKAFYNFTTAQRDAIKVAGDLKAAADAAANFITTNTTWAAFEFDGKAYAVFEATGANTTYDGTGLLVELVGSTATDLVAANFA